MILDFYITENMCDCIKSCYERGNKNNTNSEYLIYISSLLLSRHKIIKLNNDIDIDVSIVYSQILSIYEKKRDNHIDTQKKMITLKRKKKEESGAKLCDIEYSFSRIQKIRSITIRDNIVKFIFNMISNDYTKEKRSSACDCFIIMYNIINRDNYKIENNGSDVFDKFARNTIFLQGSYFKDMIKKYDDKLKKNNNKKEVENGLD